MGNNRFIRPPRISIEGYSYCGCRTYSEYNYLQDNLASRIKRRHFEIALDLASAHFHKTGVIDFGCGDGVLIPTLANYFGHVAAVDQDEDFLKVSRKVVEKLSLKNVDVINNKGMSPDELKKMLSGRGYGIIFLLEVLEHIGSGPDSMHAERIRFLKDLFELVSPPGKIIASVPKMVGPSFLLQCAGLSFMGINRYGISLGDTIRSGILYDTSNLEKDCVPLNTHAGFNHLKLERDLRKEFRMTRKVNDLFQVLYVLEKK